MTADTAPTLDDLAGRIRAEHEQVGLALHRALDHALRVGDLLLEAKALVPHGGWLPWLGEHCGLAERTAQAYMRIARNRERLPNPLSVADLGVGDALALLAAPRPHDAPPDLPTPPEPTTANDAETPAEQAAAALNRAAHALASAERSSWRVAQLTHYVVTDLGAPLDTWCKDIGLPLAEGYRYLGMWATHGRDVLAGTLEGVPMFRDADEVLSGAARERLSRSQ